MYCSNCQCEHCEKKRNSGLTADEVRELRKGRKVSAIRMIRNRTGMSLADIHALLEKRKF